MNKGVIALLLLTILLAGNGCSAPPTPEKPTESLGAKLNRIIIPDFPPTDVTLEDALEFLRVKSREFDPTITKTSQKGVNFVIISGNVKNLPAIDGLKPKDMPLSETLRYITESVGLKFVVEPQAVAVREKDDERGPSKGPSTNAHQLAMEKTILPTVQFQGATIEEAVEYLRVSRVCLDADDHTSATMTLNYVLKLRTNDKRPKISLDLKDIPLSEALRYCAEIAGVTLRYDSFAVVITEENTAPAAPPAVKGLASSLILPHVALSGATLKEAVELIRIKSRELDTAHNGVSIIIQPGDPASSIELDLKQIPVIEALRYIAELSNHMLSFENNDFVLTPVKGP
ncbi:MAG: hypothetical protein JNM65_18820 [Verrucomicrobiaceae bacterium]|nr:hypothetical protein [Verrucomicrobiaceae bacterium]